MIKKITFNFTDYKVDDIIQPEDYNHGELSLLLARLIYEQTRDIENKKIEFHIHSIDKKELMEVLEHFKNINELEMPYEIIVDEEMMDETLIIKTFVK